MDPLLDILGDRGRGLLATLKRDGRPQLSIVMYAYDKETKTIRLSVTDDRVKTKNLRRDPRATFQVQGGTYDYVVVDGDAELTPVAADPHDATVDELVDLYRAMAGEHPDWDEYREAMVKDRRLVLRIHITHAYGVGPRS
jgi:PPOX class probable F420-dependent enzyme